MKDASQIAYDKAKSIIAVDSMLLDDKGHSNSYYYQTTILENLSDNEIILGMIGACDGPGCDADHNHFFKDHLPTDECRYFRHPNGGSDHFNMRWFREWCQQNRPNILKRLDNLKNIKAFW